MGAVRNQTHDVAFSSQLYITSRSGDAVFDVDDDWLITDDVDAAGAPTVVHSFSGPNAMLEPSEAFTTVPSGSFSDTVRFALGWALFETGQHRRADRVLKRVRAPELFSQATGLRQKIAACAKGGCP